MGGGVITYLKQLCDNIDDSYEITILYGIRSQTPDNLREIFSNNINLIRINNFQREVSLRKDFMAYKEILLNLERLNPDIVHLNSSKAGAIGRIIKFVNFHKLKHVKFFYTPHGYSFQIKNGSIIKRTFYFLTELLLSNLNTNTVCCGIGEYNISKKITQKTTYINNCVEKNKFNFNNNDLYEDDVFYTVGRISEQKNPKLFNDIALLNPNKKFIWIGDGPDRSILTSKNIQVTGWVNTKDMIRIVNKYRFFILCSKWEGLPLSLLESMSMGKICFVPNINGCKEVINDGSNGFIFRSLDDINKKINSIKKEECDLISKTAMDNIKKYYSLPEFIDKYKKLYSI